jgi:hypothetical protein
MQNKEEQKQYLIDMMRGDEELGLYKEPFKIMYTEEEVISILYEQLEALDFYGSDFKFSDWFEEFRKK